MWRQLFNGVIVRVQNLRGGDIIQYVYTDSQHQNPLNRVMTAGILENNFGLEYDREKYKEMLLDGSETILGIFGFDRYQVRNQ